MKQERLAIPEFLGVPRAAIWVEDDLDTAQRIGREIERKLQVEIILFASDGSPLREAFELLHKFTKRQHRPVVMLLTAQDLRYFDGIERLLDQFPLRAVISDLTISGDNLAGLVILTAAAKAKNKPFLALYSGHVDESVRRLAITVGVDLIITKDQGPDRIIEVLVPLFGPDVVRLTSQKVLMELEQENAALRAKCHELERHLSALQQGRRGEKFPSKQRLRELNSTIEQLKKRLTETENIVNIVLAHEHDLVNTVSLTKKSLDAVCSDPRVIPPIVSEEIQRARVAAKHSSILVTSLRDLISGEVGSRDETGSISQALNEAREIIKRKVPDGVELLFDVPGDLPPSKMPEHLIVRCALNLLLNSVEAISGQGLIEVEAKKPARRSAKFLTVVFRDSGTGIRKRDMQKIFDPGFSTKGKKTGVGLFIVKKFIEAFGGAIKVESTRGEGTTVTLQIPLS